MCASHREAVKDDALGEKDVISTSGARGGVESSDQRGLSAQRSALRARALKH